jgi:hypothetical protein
MKPNPLIVLIIITALIAASGAYWFFFIKNNVEPTLSVAGTTNEETVAFQALADQLSRVTLRTDLFDDARFQSLVDTAVAIIEEPNRRADPFAPVAGISQQ